METRPLLYQALIGTTRAQSEVVSQYRDRAAETGAQGDVRELLALEMLERDLALIPRSLTVREGEQTPLPPTPSPERLTQCAGYTAQLAAVLAGGGHQLAPALLSVLEGFQVKSLLQEDTPGVPKLASVAVAAEATEKLSRTVTSSGLEVLGSWNEAEGAQAEAALARMTSVFPSSAGLVQRVVLQTFIAGDGKDNSVGGRVNQERPGEVHLARFHLDNAPVILWHEAGHELDRRMGNISASPDSPFGKGASRASYVTEYARSNASEDFAETHMDLVQNWDKYQQLPEIFLYGEGPRSEKRRFILEKCYGQKVPEPREFWPRLTQQACAADSPFGWVTASGEKIGAEADFHRTVVDFNEFPDEPPVSAKGAWLRSRLAGAEPVPSPAKTVASVAEELAALPRGGGVMIGYLTQKGDLSRAAVAELAAELGCPGPPEGAPIMTLDERYAFGMATVQQQGLTGQDELEDVRETLEMGGEKMKAELRQTAPDSALARWLLGPS